MKILCNLFQFSSSRSVLIQHRESLISKINAILEEIEAPSNIVQICISSIIMNYCVHLVSNPDQEASFQLVSSIGTNCLASMNSQEALYRVVASFGALIKQDRETKELAQALESRTALARIKCDNSEKLQECVKDCKTLLS